MTLGVCPKCCVGGESAAQHQGFASSGHNNLTLAASWPQPRQLFSSLLEHAAFTCVHAARSSMCWIARFSAFGDAASTHRALAYRGPRHIGDEVVLDVEPVVDLIETLA